MNKIAFKCLIAKQSRETKVISFVANPEQISKISRVSRVGRTETQELFGFQRSQISNHINEIHDYLSGQTTLLRAKELIRQKTRQYAKRQFTWARGHMKSWDMIYSANISDLLKKAINKIS